MIQSIRESDRSFERDVLFKATIIRSIVPMICDAAADCKRTHPLHSLIQQVKISSLTVGPWSLDKGRSITI